MDLNDKMSSVNGWHVSYKNSRRAKLQIRRNKLCYQKWSSAIWQFFFIWSESAAAGHNQLSKELHAKTNALLVFPLVEKQTRKRVIIRQPENLDRREVREMCSWGLNALCDITNGHFFLSLRSRRRRSSKQLTFRIVFYLSVYAKKATGTTKKCNFKVCGQFCGFTWRLHWWCGCINGAGGCGGVITGPLTCTEREETSFDDRSIEDPSIQKM